MSDAAIIAFIVLLATLANFIYNGWNEGRKRKWAIQDRELAEENKKLAQVGNNLAARSIELVRENTTLTNDTKKKIEEISTSPIITGSMEKVSKD